MESVLSMVLTRQRVLLGRLLRRLGLGDDSLLIPLAVVVGVVTAAAAVGFHELILLVRTALYEWSVAGSLYEWPWLVLLVVIPAAGGLMVGIISRLISGEREGHGVVDVIESVIRTRGFERPRTAFEKILTSAITIGTGGSAGAEGPIVQIGAAVSGGVGRVFRLARHQMPTLIGCGAAAGISAIFNAPLGGLLFTLEVILLDISIRTITPIIIASFIANVTMRALVGWMHEPHLGEGVGGPAYITVFADPQLMFPADAVIGWPQVPNYIVLGVVCGLIGISLARAMQWGESLASRATRGHRMLKVIRPGIGGALLGCLGVAAALVSAESIGGEGGPFASYPMPAFYSDGYGVIEELLQAPFYARFDATAVVVLLGGLCFVKIIATVLTLGTGGSGGVIAPSLFLGAAIGGALGVLLRETGLFADLRPEAYALVGMAAVLAAVVHAPLASIFILFELLGERGGFRVLLPAMLGTVVAVGVSRLILKDSLYTAALRRRGIKLTGTDPALLSRLSVEQVALDPASVVHAEDPFQKVVDLMDQTEARDFIVVDDKGKYRGMLVAEDLRTALLSREAIPLMVIGELMREVPCVEHTDDLAKTFDLFTRNDVTHLPVTLAGSDGKVIGLIGRAGLMKRYQQELEE